MLPARPLQRAYGVAATWVPIQAALDTNGAYSTAVGRFTSQHAMATRSLDLDLGHIHVKTDQFVAQRFTLRYHKEAVNSCSKLSKSSTGSEVSRRWRRKAWS